MGGVAGGQHRTKSFLSSKCVTFFLPVRFIFVYHFLSLTARMQKSLSSHNLLPCFKTGPYYGDPVEQKRSELNADIAQQR
ncbi:hypothetical protein [Pantoea stewartii]|uniref:hypothetical protein n=1 Tax=Pantoea stewartii TaxID=66269 RepID=UPI0025A012C1|nr:hypothetical protein [Pantoea stewartii]